MHLFGGKFCTRERPRTPHSSASGELNASHVSSASHSSHTTSAYTSERVLCTCEDLRNPLVKCVCNRKHFNNFLWATMTVFQILTQEDWNIVLFNGMEHTTHWAALYFVALMTFGNYVLFNLLVAILVEGFSQEKDIEPSVGSDEGSSEGGEGGGGLKPNEKLIYFYDPQEELDNIEKEIQLLSNPPGAVGCQSFRVFPGSIGSDVVSGGGGLKMAPPPPVAPSPGHLHLATRPIITHTAATPQGSPLAASVEFHATSAAVARRISSTSSSSGKSDLSRDRKRCDGAVVVIDRGREEKVAGEWKASATPPMPLKLTIQTASQYSLDKAHDDDGLCRRQLASMSPKAATPPFGRSGSPYTPHSPHTPPSACLALPPPTRFFPSSPSPASASSTSSRRSIHGRRDSSRSSLSGAPPIPSGRSASTAPASRRDSGAMSAFSSPHGVTAGGHRMSGSSSRDLLGLTLFPNHSANARQRRSVSARGSLSAIDTIVATTASSGQVTSFPIKFPPPQGSAGGRRKSSLSALMSSQPLGRLARRLKRKSASVDTQSRTIRSSNSLDANLTTPHAVSGGGRKGRDRAQSIAVGPGGLSGTMIRVGSIRARSSSATARTALCNGRVVGPQHSSGPTAQGPGPFPLPPRANQAAPTPTVRRQSVVKSMTPRNSLSGVFYCASATVVRKSSNASSILAGGGVATGKSRDEQVRITVESPTCGRPEGKQSQPVPWTTTYSVSSQDLASAAVYPVGGTNLSLGGAMMQFGGATLAEHRASQASLQRDGQQPTVRHKKHKERPSQNVGDDMKTFFKYFTWTAWMRSKEDYSLFIFAPSNPFRIWCASLADHRNFDYVILVFISMNCVTLAMERPKIPPWSWERDLLAAANNFFTIVFGVEMAIKVVAKGVWYGEDAYLRSGWNIMDGILVGFSLFDLFLSFVAQKSPRIFGILRVFRLLRSLRPLRVINRAPGLKLVVQTLLSSLRPIGNIVLICCTFFLIFGILGVQLFKGSLFYCEGPDVRNIKTKADCLADRRNKWVNRKYNFDNLGQALMALFVLSSKDGWVNIMYTGLDAVGVDMQPVENYNEWRLLYFISFLLLVAFFVLNMFVGVVVENFHRCREQQEAEERARRAEKRARKLEKRRKSMAAFLARLVEVEQEERTYEYFGDVHVTCHPHSHPQSHYSYSHPIFHCGAAAAVEDLSDFVRPPHSRMSRTLDELIGLYRADNDFLLELIALHDSLHAKRSDPPTLPLPSTESQSQSYSHTVPHTESHVDGKHEPHAILDMKCYESDPGEDLDMENLVASSIGSCSSLVRRNEAAEAEAELPTTGTSVSSQSHSNRFECHLCGSERDGDPLSTSNDSQSEVKKRTSIRSSDKSKRVQKSDSETKLKINNCNSLIGPTSVSVDGSGGKTSVSKTNETSRQNADEIEVEYESLCYTFSESVSEANFVADAHTHAHSHSHCPSHPHPPHKRPSTHDVSAVRNPQHATETDTDNEVREPPYFLGYGPLRMFVHRLVMGKYFDLIISMVIFLNVITMSLEHYQMPQGLIYTLKMFNFAFTCVFIAEATMKMAALGIRRYLSDKWNQLDVLIVILSVVGIVLEELESEFMPINPTIVRVMRVMRIARVLKLLKMAKGIRSLLDTVAQALPQVGNLGLLFFLLFFIFAALGVELFGRLECDDEFQCQGLGEHAHFQNFGAAFLTLFRVATGDNWNGIMKDTLRDKCDSSDDCLVNCCVSPIIAPIYFVFFVLLAQFTLVNVVVAVLMKHLEDAHENPDEDEDAEIDMEIARELAAEKKALEEAADRKRREEELRSSRHGAGGHLVKMNSLPSNFTFSHWDEPDLYSRIEHEATNGVGAVGTIPLSRSTHGLGASPLPPQDLLALMQKSSAIQSAHIMSTMEILPTSGESGNKTAEETAILFGKPFSRKTSRYADDEEPSAADLLVLANGSRLLPTIRQAYPSSVSPPLLSPVFPPPPSPPALPLLPPHAGSFGALQPCDTAQARKMSDLADESTTLTTTQSGLGGLTNSILPHYPELRGDEFRDAEILMCEETETARPAPATTAEEASRPTPLTSTTSRRTAGGDDGAEDGDESGSLTSAFSWSVMEEEEEENEEVGPAASK